MKLMKLVETIFLKLFLRHLLFKQNFRKIFSALSFFCLMKNYCVAELAYALKAFQDWQLLHKGWKYDQLDWTMVKFRYVNITILIRISIILAFLLIFMWWGRMALNRQGVYYKLCALKNLESTWIGGTFSSFYIVICFEIY